MLRNKSAYANMGKVMSLLLYFICISPSTTWSATINHISLLDSTGGDVLIIDADAPLEYQVFDLTDPSRVVINFPDAQINNEVVPIKGGKKGVLSLRPTNNKQGAKLEVLLDEALDYDIEEKNHQLTIRFAPSKTSTPTTDQAVLKHIQVKDKGGMTEITLHGLHMNASHHTFLTNSGKTLVVDFWGGSSQIAQEYTTYPSQHVKAVTVGASEGRLRLAIALTQANRSGQQIDASAEQLTIRLGAVETTIAPEVTVESVLFQPDGKKSRVMIRTNVTNPIIFVHDDNEQNTIVDIKGATLLQGLELTQDLRAFAGPLAQIDTYRFKDQVRIVMRSREKVEVTSFQQGNIFTLNFSPEAIAHHTKGIPGIATYTGEKVTFDFKDIDIRNALKLIAEMSNLNIIMSDDVSGTLTMRLVDVPWDQALDLILSARGLGKEQTGNVLRVAPIEVLRSEYELKIEARKGSQQLETLVTAFMTLSYTKVSDVKKMLHESAKKNSSKSKGTAGSMPEAGNAGLMSQRGSILIDERTNTLIIRDTQEAINNIKRLMVVIDKPIQQVLIEARIVEASDSFSHSVGIRWGGSYSRGVDTLGAAASGDTTTASRGMLVDLPAAFGSGQGGAIGLSLGSLASLLNLDLELSAAQADGKAKIISSPRIVTSNLKTATVTQGAQIAIVTPGSNSSPATTQLVTAALTLKVTPQITADDGVILDIVVTKDSPTIFNGETGIDSKAITTNVYVKNGETIVIGGIYTRDKSENNAGVPLLADLPFLGWLFKNKATRDNKTELLIFITPKILQSSTGS